MSSEAIFEHGYENIDLVREYDAATLVKMCIMKHLPG